MEPCRWDGCCYNNRTLRITSWSPRKVRAETTQCTGPRTANQTAKRWTPQLWLNSTTQRMRRLAHKRPQKHRAARPSKRGVRDESGCDPPIRPITKLGGGSYSKRQVASVRGESLPGRQQSPA